MFRPALVPAPPSPYRPSALAPGAVEGTGRLAALPLREQPGAVGRLDVPYAPTAVQLPTGSLTAAYEAGARPDTYVPRDEAVLSLAALDSMGLLAAIAALQQYERLWLPDAAPDDSTSYRRRIGEQIVQQAIEAMGGARALSRIRSMSLVAVRDTMAILGSSLYHPVLSSRAAAADELATGTAWFSFGNLVHRFSGYLPGGSRVVYDGHQAWVVLPGGAQPLAGAEADLIRRRAERWDFLSRFVGDGVQLSYLGLQQGERQAEYHAVRVDDYRFGGVPFVALFDAHTHLLAAEEYPPDRPRLVRRFLDYGDRKSVV